jgi:hypothetical protein
MHFGVRAFNKARRSLDRIGWYSQDRSARVPMVDVREKMRSLIHVFDTLSGKQAVADRNSWARIHHCKDHSPAAMVQDPFMEAVGQRLKKGELQHQGHHMRVSHGDLERGPVYHLDKQHPIVVNLSSDKIEAPGSSDCVHLSIACEDTGAGIPEEARACIFKPFVQVSTSLCHAQCLLTCSDISRSIGNFLDRIIK